MKQEAVGFTASSYSRRHRAPGQRLPQTVCPRGTRTLPALPSPGLQLSRERTVLL